MTVTLTANEKLIARALLAGEAVAAVGQAVGVPAAETATALRVLRELGFLKGQALAPEAVRFEEGIGLNFHAVLVEGEPAFSVH